MHKHTISFIKDQNAIQMNSVNPIISKLLFISLALLIMSCNTEEPVDLNNTKITVDITDALNHPYSNVLIDLISESSVQKSVRSGQLGSYTFLNLEEGQYEVIAQTPLASQLEPTQSIMVNLQKDEHGKAKFKVTPEAINARVVWDEGDVMKEVKNANSGIPMNDNETLYARNWFDAPIGSLHAILAPDGHHVTLAEWKEAKGTVQVNCDGNETHYKFEFEGLIENGVYTLWIAPLSSSQTFEEFTENSMIGLGAVGGADQNFFDFSSGATLQKEVTMSGGALTVWGSIGGCALASENGLIIVLDYHIDGQTYGDTAGPDHTEVGHLLFLM